MKTATELYQDLVENFSVTSSFRVGFSKEISPGVLEVIKLLKGDLNSQDIVPIPTELTIVVKDITNQKILGTFHQTSSVYLESFDKDAFEVFVADLFTKASNTLEEVFISDKEKLQAIAKPTLNNLN